MLELIATLIILVIVIQLMAIVDEHKRFEKLERNVAEIINNELKVYKSLVFIYYSHKLNYYD